VLDGLDDLVKTVGFRDLSGRLSCIAGIGDDLWDRLQLDRRPSELRRFAPIKGPVHAAPSTPGDLLFHIRAERPDLCFEFERILPDSLSDGVSVVDETSGFRYFDARDLLGFVDGTANPTGLDLPAAALVGDEDTDFAGGSYVVVQKYLHDLKAWARVPTQVQEAIIGRTKIDNIEIDDDDAPRKSHKSLATIADADGTEYDILRDNMPFGRPGQQEFGTYFIGYSRYLWVIEKMLQRMYVGDPPGAYDRLLDFSTPHTGATFFAPARPTLQKLVEAAQEKIAAAPASKSSAP
jgi:porphyrinogen peroxidase